MWLSRPVTPLGKRDGQFPPLIGPIPRVTPFSAGLFEPSSPIRKNNTRSVRFNRWIYVSQAVEGSEWRESEPRMDREDIATQQALDNLAEQMDDTEEEKAAKEEIEDNTSRNTLPPGCDRQWLYKYGLVYKEPNEVCETPEGHTPVRDDMPDFLTVELKPINETWKEASVKRAAKRMALIFDDLDEFSGVDEFGYVTDNEAETDAKLTAAMARMSVSLKAIPVAFPKMVTPVEACEAEVHENPKTPFVGGSTENTKEASVSGSGSQSGISLGLPSEFARGRPRIQRSFAIRWKRSEMDQLETKSWGDFDNINQENTSPVLEGF